MGRFAQHHSNVFRRCQLFLIRTLRFNLHLGQPSLHFAVKDFGKGCCMMIAAEGGTGSNTKCSDTVQEIMRYCFPRPEQLLRTDNVNDAQKSGVFASTFDRVAKMPRHLRESAPCRCLFLYAAWLSDRQHRVQHLQVAQAKHSHAAPATHP